MTDSPAGGGDPPSAGGHEQPLLPPGSLYRSAWIFYLVLAVAGVLWIGFALDDIPLGLFIDLETWWIDLAIGIGGGLVLLALWIGARQVFVGARNLEEALAGVLGTLTVDEAIGLALVSGFA
ncbi:MAG: hypothetical protein AAGD38_09485, partial [Acidobacteriota bacterium]